MSEFGYRVYGKADQVDSPTESAVMISFFSWLRREHQEYAAIATHIPNEGKRSYQKAHLMKAEGMTKGAADVIIPCSPPFVMELKTCKKGSRPSDYQKKYLERARRLGAFACVAYGIESAKLAFCDYLRENVNTNNEGKTHV